MRFELHADPVGAGRSNARVLAASMPVPEASMNENNGHMPLKNDIRLSRQCTVMVSEAKSGSVKE